MDLDLNYLLLWFVGLSSIFAVASAKRQIGRIPPALLVPLLALIAALVVAPDVAGYFAFAVWLGSTIVPQYAFRLTYNAARQGNGEEFRIGIMLLRFLSPSPDWAAFDRPLPEILNSIETIPKKALTTVAAQEIILALLEYRCQWDRVIRLVRAEPRLLAGQEAQLTLVRALGEVGAYTEMLQVAAKSLTNPRLTRSVRNSLMLYTSALYGDPATTMSLLDSLDHWNKGESDFWRASAMIRAGNHEAGRALLEDLKTQKRYNISAVTQRIAESERRDPKFTHGEPFKNPLISIPPSTKRTIGVGTKALIAITALVFILQQLVSINIDPELPFAIGALFPILVTEHHQWWRLLSCVFLHAGLLHIGANMLGLYVLGPDVERRFGTLRFVIAYLSFGVGSSLFVVLLTEYGVLDQAVLIGASGAVMGLVGAAAAIAFRLWQNSRSRRALEQLKSVIFIVVLQSLFDLSTPQVSFSAHFGGVLAGFFLTLFVFDPIRQQKG